MRRRRGCRYTVQCLEGCIPCFPWRPAPRLPTALVDITLAKIQGCELPRAYTVVCHCHAQRPNGFLFVSLFDSTVQCHMIASHCTHSELPRTAYTMRHDGADGVGCETRWSGAGQVGVGCGKPTLQMLWGCSRTELIESKVSLPGRCSELRWRSCAPSATRTSCSCLKSLRARRDFTS